MPVSYDAIVIGAGQAGPSLASRLTESGRRVAFFERKLFGGTCVNAGCTPTKAMVASAYAAHLARRSNDFGVQIGGEIAVDMKAVKARKDAIVAQSRDGIEAWLRGMKNCTVYHQAARFVSSNHVQAGRETFTAPEIFINVGGRPTVPDMPGADSVPFLTSTTLLDLDTLPQHLIVVGGSYIGLEFAQMFRRFGSEVTVVEQHERLVLHEDEDVAAAIKDILEQEDIQFRLNARCISLMGHGHDISVSVNCTVGEPLVHGTHVLLAVGRTPNTDDLGLKEAGVKTDEKGFIVVDDQLRTNVPGIWAIGDCNGRGAFTHTSWNDYEIVAANLLDNDPRRVSDRIPVHGLFVDPPLGQIGMTETQVRKSGRPALIGTRPMTKVGRAVEKGESLGFMKILVDAETKQILGASILGTGGDEAVHCLLDTMYAKAPYTTVQRAMHIHPTVSELIPTVLGGLKPLM
jgi:pyruvate/2-oxoglutarate dehydrogenase complex dihydrolipoamide dehydrogenase (E3) component